MKEKKSRLVFIISFLLVLLAIILITISIIMTFITNNNKRNNNNIGNNNDDVPIVDSDDNIQIKKYVCKNKLDDVNNSYEVYQIETITVKEDIVLLSMPTITIYCKDEITYNSFKNDEEYSKNKNFDDVNKIITFENGEIKDMTKDSTGKDLQLNYSMYQNDLSKIGYICTES